METAIQKVYIRIISTCIEEYTEGITIMFINFEES
jgi:hypothetical protein